MFSKRVRLFRVSGFPVELDLSWFVIAVLLTWSLAAGFFPYRYEGLSRATYWAMGSAGALGLFASIVLHEIGHAMVARRFDLPIRRIVLFIFGGVAEMEREPDEARHEFLVAVAGPAVSLALAGVFHAVALGLVLSGAGAAAVGVAAYLALINLVLVAFNLVPAFPLDGGRVLRSALWAWKGDFRWATRITSAIGSVFAIALIGLGVFAVIAGRLLAGIWWALLGLFLHGAAGMAYQQVRLRKALEGEPLSRFMTREPVVVPPDMTVRELVEDRVYRYQHKLFPVVRDDRLLGCVTLRGIRQVPRDEWDRRTVRDIVEECSEDNTIESDQDAMAALARMNGAEASRIMVLERGRLVGVLALKDLMRFLALKVELEERP